MGKLPDNREALVSGIFEQAKGEEDAKMKYMEFLSCYKEKLQAIDVATIMEIVGDEQNHTVKLLAMAQKYGRIVPADDDLKEALNSIAGKK